MKKIPSKLLVFIIVIVLILGSAGYYYFNNVPSFNPKPGTCKILEQKFCNKVKFISNKNQTVGMYMLPKGTTLFAPNDFSTLETFIPLQNSRRTKSVPTLSLVINNQPNGIILESEKWTFYFNYDVNQLPKTNNTLEEAGKEGQVLGKILNTNPIFEDNNYNLVVNVKKVVSPLIHPSTISATTQDVTKKMLK